MKVVLVGDSAVGKTSIINAINNKKLEITKPTINFAKSDLTVKASSGEEVTLCIWDTAGQEIYQSLAPMHVHNSKAQILVFDVNYELSFTNLQRWLEILEESNSLNCIFIVGNKIDLPSDERQVSTDVAFDYATKINAKYVEVSAKTGDGIEELFEQIADQLIKKDPQPADTQTVEVDQQKDEKKNYCC